MLSRQLATIVEDVEHPLEAFSTVQGCDLQWRAPQAQLVADILRGMQLDSIASERYLALLDALSPIGPAQGLAS